MSAKWPSLEKWFLEVVRAPEPLDEALRLHAPLVGGAPLDALVTRSSLASERDRLGVYRHAYFARLEECLADDYPATRAGLGEDEFSRLARDYAVRHPSCSFTLNVFGARFGAFLAEAGLGFWAELAGLEWLLVLAVHSPAAVSTLAEDLARLGDGGIAGARLALNEAAVLYDSRFPVNRALQAFFTKDEVPTLPEAESPSSVLVVRQGYKLWRLDLDVEERRVLGRLREGATLGAALEGLAVAPSDVQRWFRTWAEKGVVLGARA